MVDFGWPWHLGNCSSPEPFAADVSITPLSGSILKVCFPDAHVAMRVHANAWLCVVALSITSSDRVLPKPFFWLILSSQHSLQRKFSDISSSSSRYFNNPFPFSFVLLFATFPVKSLPLSKLEIMDLLSPSM